MERHLAINATHPLVRIWYDGIGIRVGRLGFMMVVWGGMVDSQEGDYRRKSFSV